MTLDNVARVGGASPDRLLKFSFGTVGCALVIVRGGSPVRFAVRPVTLARTNRVGYSASQEHIYHSRSLLKGRDYYCAGATPRRTARRCVRAVRRV
jgi:hypothetical protein